MIQTGAASYEELLAEFNAALDSALSGTAPVKASATLSPTLLMSLNDIANAVRDNRPTQNLITLACAAFTVYAADRNSMRHGPGKRRAQATAAMLKRRGAAQPA